MPSRELTPAEITFQAQTGLQLGKKIYSGNGNVYRLKGYPARLAKIASAYSDSVLRRTIKVLRYLKRNQSPAVVKIYQMGHFMAKLGYDGAPNTQLYYFYYVMEKLRLLPASGREKKVWTIGAHLDNDQYYIERLQEMGETTDSVRLPPKVRTFINRARALKYSHTDIHDWNIMQDKRGTLKFIDLESFK